MKEHFQDYGVRKWAGDDLIELQSEPLAALQALVSPYAPCIVSGCETALNDAGGYTVSAGLVALAGKDAKGNDCVKIVRANGITLADTNQVCYLTLGHQTLTRTYMDGQSKAIAYNYMAQQSTTQPQDVPYLEITSNGGRRLVDTLGITQKLNSEGGEAKDVKVTFADPLPKEMEDIASGTKLGVLISNIKAWLKRKVDVKEDYGLSKNDFTDAFKEKLEGIDKGANKYSLPAATAEVTGGVKLGSDTVQIWPAVAAKSTINKSYPVQQDGNGRLVVNVPWTNTVYTHPPYTAQDSGLYKITVDDKGHVNAVIPVEKSDITNLGIPGQDTNTVYTHPTTAGNKHIPSGGESGQYLKYSSSGTATWAKPTASEIGAAASDHTHAWGNITGKPTEFAPSSHTHTPSQCGAAASGHTHTLSSLGAASTSIATQAANGLMSADDKKKLDGIPVTISVKGNQLTFTWRTHPIASNGTALAPYYTYTYTTEASSYVPY